MSTPKIPCRKYTYMPALVLPKSKIDERTKIRDLEKHCGLEPYTARYRTKKGYSYAYDIDPIPQKGVEPLLNCIVKAGIKGKVFSNLIKVWVSDVKWNPVKRMWRTIRVQVSYSHGK